MNYVPTLSNPTIPKGDDILKEWTTEFANAVNDYCHIGLTHESAIHRHEQLCNTAGLYIIDSGIQLDAPKDVDMDYLIDEVMSSPMPSAYAYSKDRFAYYTVIKDPESGDVCTVTTNIVGVVINGRYQYRVQKVRVENTQQFGSDIVTNILDLEVEDSDKMQRYVQTLEHKMVALDDITLTKRVASNRGLLHDVKTGSLFDMLRINSIPQDDVFHTLTYKGYYGERNYVSIVLYARKDGTHICARGGVDLTIFERLGYEVVEVNEKTSYVIVKKTHY